jgi:hypothetical protein
MLTGFQVSPSGARITEYGEVYCESCSEDEYTRSVSNYELDEIQTRMQDSDSVCCEFENGERVWQCNMSHLAYEPYITVETCEQGLYCQDCGEELAPEWHDDFEHEQAREAAGWTTD